MKILSALALSVVLAVASPSNPNTAAPAAPAATPIPFSVAYEAIQACSVTVIASEGSGSGTVILKANGDAWVITAAHVIGSSKADVVLVKQVVVGGRAVGSYSVDAEVVSVNSTQDLAVLKPRSAYFFKTGARFEAADYVPSLGEPVTHCGSMQGLPGAESITVGVVSFAGRVMEGLIFDQISAPAMSGSSGGGVWNSAGKFVGTVVSGYGDVFIYIVPVRRIHAWAVAEGHPEWIGLDKVP